MIVQAWMWPVRLMQPCSPLLHRLLKSNYLFAPDCAERARTCPVPTYLLRCCQVVPRESLELDRRKALSGPDKNHKAWWTWFKPRTTAVVSSMVAAEPAWAGDVFARAKAPHPKWQCFQPSVSATGKETEASKRRRSQADRKGQGVLSFA